MKSVTAKLSAVLTLGLLLMLSPLAAPAGAIGVSSVSAIVIDVQTKTVLFEQNAHAFRAVASTTKLMTALIGAEDCLPEEEIVVPPDAVKVEGSALGLRGGDFIHMQDLLTGMLLASGNDAANTVALHVSGSLSDFAVRMNKRAALLGMKNTRFVTPSGLDEGENGSTAYDMALLGAEVVKNKQLREICTSKTAPIYFGNPKRQVVVRNHNRLLWRYKDTVGLKTGFTRRAGRCLVSAAQRGGVTLVAVTLGGGNDWQDHETMLEYGFSQLKSAEIPPLTLPVLPVAGGVESSVPLTVTLPGPLTVRRSEKGEFTAKILLPRFVVAPVLKGEEVGALQIYLAGELLQETPIRTSEEIDVRGKYRTGGRFTRWITRLTGALLK